jgi:atypical dual specificity phosphatase
MERFYWLIPGVLAGCSRPGARHGHRGQGAALAEDLAALAGEGIGAVLSLTEDPLPAEALAAHGLACLHLPVADLHPLTPQEFRLALAFIDRQRAAGQPVAVHCLAGQGRTGSVLAAYLIRAGAEPAEALSRLRDLCPGAVENAAQEAALAAFAAQREWLL